MVMLDLLPKRFAESGHNCPIDHNNISKK